MSYEIKVYDLKTGTYLYTTMVHIKARSIN